VGERVRELRKAQGLSARALAERSGATPAYISRLESGKVSPTVATLTRVMDALGEPLWRVFSDGSASGPVVRADERSLIQNNGFTDALLTPTRAGRLEIVETEIEPGVDSGGEYTFWSEEEFVLVIEGRLRFWLRGEEHDLGPGDSITFSGRLPRRWKNDGRSVTKVIWVMTPGGAAAI
jgi:transcriptional regulator with XRE-family HTH domain